MQEKSIKPSVIYIMGYLPGDPRGVHAENAATTPAC